MAWIETVDEEAAEGALAPLYARLKGKDGKVAHILKVQSTNPGALETHYALYRAIMFKKSPLSRAQREMIAVTVSAANECHY